MVKEASCRKHPNYHPVKVVLTNGEQFEVETCWGKENDVLTLDIDPLNHPAWRKEAGTVTNTKNNVLMNFKKKYGNVFDN